MLLNDFYKILCKSIPEEIVSPSGVVSWQQDFNISLNPAHRIYEGHFEGNPVVPGVCQIQIISELSSLAAGAPLRLVTADNVKFPVSIIPGNSSQIEVRINLRTDSEGCFVVNATLTGLDKVFIRFKGLFRKESLCQ